MRDASLEFRKKMYTNTDFYQTAHIVFSNGEEKELNKKDFYISGNIFSDGAGTTSFPLGEAIAKHISIVLVNDDDRFSDYDFYLAKITVYLKYPLKNSTETILFGTFTVTTPESYGTQVTVEALDDMYKGDCAYSTSLKYPLTLKEILIDSCLTCGIPLFTTTFTNMDYLVEDMPQNITHRQLWGMIAMIAGGNARTDEYNRLKIMSYDFSYFENYDFDGGKFDKASPYQTGINLNGGDFSPWNNGDEVDGGDFAGLKDYHFFYKNKLPYITTDDVVITGIQTVVDEKIYLFGTEGYILSISNQLIENDPQTAVNLIGSLLVGVRFRPFSIEHIAYPLAEPGDICYLADRKNNVYQSVVTDIAFNFYGRTTIKCTADSPLRNSSEYFSESTKAIVAARKETKKQITAYDLAVQQLTNLITNSFGVFKTEEVLEDGSTIYYLHNKPELTSSSTIWKMTSDAFAVSTDGGKTWNAGMTSEGNAVVNVLSAIGINADWVNAGTMLAERIQGGILSLGGQRNTNGVAEVKDASGNVLIRLDNNGIIMADGTYISWSNIQNANEQVVKITKDTVDAPFIKTLKLEVGNEILMGENAVIAWEKVQGANEAVVKITKDTVDAPFIKTLKLEVGNQILMGENAVISWGQVENKPDDLAYTSDIPTDSYITQITKDTITSAYIKALKLSVGNEILMGENAVISWGSVQDKPTDLAYTGDIPTDNSQLKNGAGYQTSSQVTTITKNTITTEYVNALKIVAGSVAAENITGQTITGKNFRSTDGKFGLNSNPSDGWAIYAGEDVSGIDRKQFCVGHEGNVYMQYMVATGGTIGGFNITENGLSIPNPNEDPMYFGSIFPGSAGLELAGSKITVNSSYGTFLNGYVAVSDYLVSPHIILGGSQVNNQRGYCDFYNDSNTLRGSIYAASIDDEVDGFWLESRKSTPLNLKATDSNILLYSNTTIYNNLRIGEALSVTGNITSQNVGSFSAIKIGENSDVHSWLDFYHQGTLYGNIYTDSDGFRIFSKYQNLNLQCQDTIHLWNNVEYHGAFGAASSKKYKDNIIDISEVDSGKIMNLRPVEFDYKNNNYHSCGFIAEEVVKILPQIVGFKDGKPDNIDYIKLIPYIIKELQKINKKIEEK